MPMGETYEFYCYHLQWQTAERLYYCFH